jgi:hypothetical protein
VFLRAVTMQGRADTQEKLEAVAEIVTVVPIETVRPIIDGELGAEADVESVAVR